MDDALKQQLRDAGYTGDFELSELIAECGDELVSINKEVGVAFGGKPCFTGRWHALGQLIKAKGDTPKEAVARLYLLNKKP